MFSIPQLEALERKTQNTTGGNWESITSNNMIKMFEHDVGVCSGMPFIDLSKKPEEYVRPGGSIDAT